MLAQSSALRESYNSLFLVINRDAWFQSNRRHSRFLYGEVNSHGSARTAGRFQSRAIASAFQCISTFIAMRIVPSSRKRGSNVRAIDNYDESLSSYVIRSKEKGYVNDAYLCRPGNQWWAESRRLVQWRGCPCRCWCSRCWSWCCHLCWAVDDCSRRGCYRRGSCCCRPAAGRAGDGESARIRCCWCANSPPWLPFRSPTVDSVRVVHPLLLLLLLLLLRHLLLPRPRRRSQNERRHRRRPRPPCNRNRRFSSQRVVSLILPRVVSELINPNSRERSLTSNYAGSFDARETTRAGSFSEGKAGGRKRKKKNRNKTFPSAWKFDRWKFAVFDGGSLEGRRSYE